MLVPLYKGKGDFNKLDNWRGIALLPWTRKVLMRCMLTRLKELAALCIEKTQSAYTTARSCVDVTHTLRRILEDYRVIQEKTDGQGRDAENDLFLLFCRQILKPTRK